MKKILCVLMLVSFTLPIMSCSQMNNPPIFATIEKEQKPN